MWLFAGEKGKGREEKGVLAREGLVRGDGVAEVVLFLHSFHWSSPTLKRACGAFQHGGAVIDGAH